MTNLKISARAEMLCFSPLSRAEILSFFQLLMKIIVYIVFRVSPFQCWLGHIKSFLKEENPELSDGELMKIAMKQWRETPKGEKEIWEKNAKVDGVGEKITNHEEKEMSKKKRKRKDENSGEDSTSKSDEATVAENKNITKKVKTYDKQKASAKLAGFAFNKRE